MWGGKGKGKMRNEERKGDTARWWGIKREGGERENGREMGI